MTISVQVKSWSLMIDLMGSTVLGNLAAVCQPNLVIPVRKSETSVIADRGNLPR